MNKPIAELETLSETEKLYRINERIAEFHASAAGNWDWNKVMDDKWGMLRWSGVVDPQTIPTSFQRGNV